MSVLHLALSEKSYDITVERGVLARAAGLMKLDRRVLILTDQGVPARYATAVAAACREPHVVTLPAGEANKCMDRYQELLRIMVEAGFDRGDCVVAVGGGVMGDLAGFAAATYMRGIDFYNVPTTLLAQVDSSIGGKVAVDFAGYKNIIGAFYQPRAVLIDPEVLSTLDPRQYACGMAEAVKMFACCDAEMFDELERREDCPVDEVILRALKIKKTVVEQDEKEKGLRRVLNFGHTVGHAIESLSAEGTSPLLHGECVGIGMLCMSAPPVRARIAALLRRFSLPVSWEGETAGLQEAILHDKKASGDRIHIIKVEEIGHFTEEAVLAADIVRRSREVITLR